MTRKLAIDGPSGAGKSTVARQIAKDLGISYLDTGSMYRAITLDMLEQGIDTSDRESVRQRLGAIHLEMKSGSVLLNGVDVTERVREDDVTAKVSMISSYDFVREKLVAMQRAIAKEQDVVLDGRDIGTVVLPDADLKIFLTASAEERARRRMLDEKSDTRMSYEEILEDINRRDDYDSHREVSPLRQAEDAIRIDSSHLTLQEVVQKIEQAWQ